MVRFITILLLILSSTFYAYATTESGPTTTTKIDNLAIAITGDYKVEVYIDEEHMFSYDCSKNALCNIFTANKSEPEYSYSDGALKTSNDVFDLSIENIKKFSEGNANFKNNYIAFIVSLTSPTSYYGHRTHYKINTDTGGVWLNKREWDWMRYGMPKPEGD